MAAIQIEVKGLGEVEKMMTGFQVNIPKAVDMDAKDIMNRLKQNLKLASMDVRWMGLLESSIGYNKTKEGEYIMTMKRYGRALDEMKPHIVKVEGKPVLEQWAEQKLGFIPRYLYVKPHPWIAEGIKDTRKEVKEATENGATVRLIRRKGRG